MSSYGLARNTDIRYLNMSVNGDICTTYTGKHTLSANQIMNVLLNNPANSGMNVVLFMTRIFADSSCFIETMKNPNTGLPTTAHTVEKTNYALSYSGATTMKADNSGSAMSGGTALNYVGGTNSIELVREMVYVFPPGMSLGYTLTAGSNGSNCYMGFYWIEQTVRT